MTLIKTLCLSQIDISMHTYVTIYAVKKMPPPKKLFPLNNEFTLRYCSKFYKVGIETFTFILISIHYFKIKKFLWVGLLYDS